jgi:hypothetical protein
MGKIRIRDPGWKKSRSEINIPDPQHWIKTNMLHLVFQMAPHYY